MKNEKDIVKEMKKNLKKTYYGNIDVFNGNDEYEKIKLLYSMLNVADLSLCKKYDKFEKLLNDIHHKMFYKIIRRREINLEKHFFNEYSSSLHLMQNIKKTSNEHKFGGYIYKIIDYYILDRLKSKEENFNSNIESFKEEEYDFFFNTLTDSSANVEDLVMDKENKKILYEFLDSLEDDKSFTKEQKIEMLFTDGTKNNSIKYLSKKYGVYYIKVKNTYEDLLDDLNEIIYNK